MIKKIRENKPAGCLEERRDSQCKSVGNVLPQPQNTTLPLPPAQHTGAECEETEVDQHVRQQLLQRKPQQHSSSVTGNKIIIYKRKRVIVFPFLSVVLLYVLKHFFLSLH